MTQLRVSPLPEEEIRVISTTLTILLMQLNTVKLYNDSSRLHKGTSVCVLAYRVFHHFHSCN